MTAIVSTASRIRRTPALADLGLALAATVCVLAIFAIGGFARLTDANGDNDSLMRMVEVRDLLAGQGWFDLHQYRMGPEGGFLMHWSRLVDLPIATIILAVAAMGVSQPVAETVAMVAWPLALFALSVFIIVRTARSIAGEWAILPAAAIGAGTLYFTNVFAPGALDHHNLQLMLVLATIMWLVRGDGPGAALAGGCSALTLAVGMETAPYVAISGAAVAVLYLFDGERGGRVARPFGLAFGLVTAAAFLVTVPPRDWFVAHCDALSSFQLGVAAVGGLGLAALTLVAPLRDTFPRRLVGLVGLAIAVAAVVALGFPQCLGDPYAALDPKLKRYWLNAVSEAQSVRDIVAAGELQIFAAYHVTPLIALVVLGWRVLRTGFERGPAILWAFLLAAVMVSFWQLRGSVFSLSIAAMALACWVGDLRRRAGDGIAGQLSAVAAWLVSFNLLWAFAGLLVSPSSADNQAGDETTGSDCYRAADYEMLARLEPGTVLAVSNQGAAILRYTQHRVLSGPYHRNGDGNLLALDLLMGADAEAAGALRGHDIDYVALCPGNAETRAIAKWAPDGLLARLDRGDNIDGLVPVNESLGASMTVYRVVAR